MDKHWSEPRKFNAKKYAYEQLHQLTLDIEAIKCKASVVSGSVVMVKCGLETGHDFEFLSYNPNIWPCRKPRGVYEFKCNDCGEKLLIPADQLHRNPKLLALTKGL